MLCLCIYVYGYLGPHIQSNLETVPIYKERLPVLAETIYSRNTLATNTHQHKRFSIKSAHTILPSELFSFSEAEQRVMERWAV